ncbi:hypothetical protein Glove_460g24 [Diversispora epigaea]|uniref:Uncharacterized protein n=1 Tax=Diversispora epigaea TaxID=1348612 RepID=A0A397GWX1_9GLOM|nr:hypothetical protein Glove_460g24 [Diversispora epigaea]
MNEKPCLFATFVDLYHYTKQLVECETKEIQRIRNTSTNFILKKIQLFIPYFPELSNIQNELEKYSICEKHYNQIIAKDNYLNYLKEETLYYPRKRSRNINYLDKSNSIDNNLQTESITSIDIGVQVTMDNTLLLEIESLKNSLDTLVSGHSKQSQIIKTSNNRIFELENERKNLKTQINELYSKLESINLYLNQFEKLILEKNKLENENKYLKEQWDGRYDNQKKRIIEIDKIASMEREHLYDDIMHLITNQNRFSLQNLLEYNPLKWIEYRNPVIVKFIETLTNNDQDNQKEQQSNKTKIFKRAVAIDSIYGSRHNNYISAINLAVSAIKYTLGRSKTIIDIDSHITSGGSYTKFINWLESLSKESSPIPEGFLVLAFDNEQKGQKNYLDRGFNTVVFHTVTSFIACNFDFSDKNQYITDPWISNSLTEINIQQLFNLTPDMKNILEKELINYINEIIDELIIEKKKDENEIDKLILSQNSSMGKMKKCINCGKTEIENKRKNCPKCNMKLPTLNTINQISSTLNSINQILPISSKSNETKEKKLKIKSHIFQKTNYQPETRVSITQKSLTDKDVKIPTLYIPDPIPINPNSISNIKKVLEHIYEITGIKSGQRKWVVVVCDGVPYNLIQKIKKEFPWLILIPGALHEEMNMLKAFVELNWLIDIKEFAQTQGYRTDNQLAFFKKCADHHKSWDSICNIYRHAMAMELIWPFVLNYENPTVHEYLEWSQKQTSNIYKLKFEQIFIYLQAIINFRNGVRTNNSLLQNAARHQFSPIWSARRHPIYRLIEITYEEQMQKLKPPIHNMIEKYCVISRSGYKNQHQGLDAILEEINKTLKSLVPPVPSQHHWEIAARNYNESSGPRTKPDFVIESQRFRIQLRKSDFLNPIQKENTFKSLGNIILSEELKNFTSIAQEKRKIYIKQKLLQLTTNETWEVIPISAEEAVSQKNENNMTKEQLVAIINSLLVSLPESQKLNSGPRTKPDFVIESQRFRIQLRKSDFLNPIQKENTFKSLGNIILSEELKNFTSIAQEKRKIYIKQKLLQLTTNETWEVIPISAEEAVSQKNENNMTKEQLVAIINSLLVSLPESQKLKDRDKKLTQQKSRITDLHCQNFETLRVTETWNISNDSNSEDSDKNSQDRYTSDSDMSTISELADAINNYLDIPGTNRQILKNQIKRATGEIHCNYTNLQTVQINEQRVRYNAEAERDLRQTDLDNALNNLNLMTTAYNNERNIHFEFGWQVYIRQQYFLELQQCRIRIGKYKNDLLLCDIQLDLKWGKWKNRSRNAEQLILNLQGQILLLQNNPLNMAIARRLPILKYVSTLTNPISQYMALAVPNMTALENANVGDFDDAVKVEIMKGKMVRKYAPVPAQNDFVNLPVNINSPDTLRAWLNAKYQRETIGTNQSAILRLSQERFQPFDNSDTYELRICPLLLGVANDDARVLRTLKSHLSGNRELYSWMKSEVIGVLQNNGSPSLPSNKKSSVKQHNNIISQPIVSQLPSQDFQKMFQDELAKRDAKYEADTGRMEKNRTDSDFCSFDQCDIAKRDAEMKKMKADFDTKMSQQSKIQPTQSIDQSPALPPGREYRRDEYYTNKFMDDNERGRDSNWGGDLNNTLPSLPKYIQNQSARIKKLENDINRLWGVQMKLGIHFVPLEPIFNNDDENSYNEEDNIWYEPEKKNEYQSSVVKSKQNKVGSESHCLAIVDSPVTTFDKLFPESDDQLLKLLSPAIGGIDTQSMCTVTNKALNDALG